MVFGRDWVGLGELAALKSEEDGDSQLLVRTGCARQSQWFEAMFIRLRDWLASLTTTLTHPVTPDDDGTRLSGTRRAVIGRLLAVMFGPKMDGRDEAKSELEEMGESDFELLVAAVLKAGPAPPNCWNAIRAMDRPFNRDVLCAAAEALGDDGSPWTINPLIALLWAGCWHTKLYHPLFDLWVGAEVCQAAVKALGRVGDLDVLPHLNRLLWNIEHGPLRAPERVTNLEVASTVRNAIDAIRARARPTEC